MVIVRVIGWSLLGAVIAGVPAFILAIVATGVSEHSGGDPTARGITAAAIVIELGFVTAVLIGLVAGGCYGLIRERRHRSPSDPCGTQRNA